MAASRRRFVTQKIVFAVLTVFAVITFNFFLFRVLPGDPAVGGMRDPRLSPERVEALRQRFGVDDPVFLNFEGGNVFESQYFAYLGALSNGDLGTSYAFRDQQVTTLLTHALVNTLWLVVPAQIISIVLGVGLGLIAAYRRGTRVDVSALTFSLIMWSLPTFFLGIILLFLGTTWFDLPAAGRVTIGAQYTDVWGQIGDIVSHMILPTATLSLVLLGEYMLIMRSSVVEVLGEDYILTARAVGIRRPRILRRHAFRNAMLPIVTLIALNLGFTVSGAIQVETVFSWPGLGHLTVDAVNQRDFPVLQGAFLLLALSVVIANLIVELIYGYLDPRVKEA